MDRIAQINGVINSFVWGPIMLILIVGVGVYYTVRLKFFQVGKIQLWMKNTFGKLFHPQAAGEGAITPVQALTTALAATVGTGNIVGVTTAIVSGGPGAVFWMWVSAFFGMMTKYAEIVLSLRYRERNAKGDWVGGPMYYINSGLGKGFSWLAVLFATFGALAAYGIGNMTQINSITTSVETLAVDLGIIASAAPDGVISPLKLTVGIFLAIVAAFVLIGGLKRIGTVTERLVPVMSVLYIVGSLAIIIVNIGNLGNAFGLIFGNAFTLRSAGGGVLGYTMMQAMRYGIARGVFSNEAGLGSAPIAHAAADTDNPVKQGLWGIFEVFVDTIIICTMTAMVVLTSGVLTPDNTLVGAPLTIAAFSSVFGILGTAFVTISITLFAFSTVLSWSLYGQRCVEYLFKGKGARAYQIVFVCCIVLSSVMRLTLAWDISDTLNGLMAVPNLIALIALSGTVFKLTAEFLASGKNA